MCISPHPSLSTREDEPLSDLFFCQPKFPGPCYYRGFSCRNLFFFSPIGEHLGWFYSWAIMDNAAETILESIAHGTHMQADLLSFYPGVGLFSHRACVQWYHILPSTFINGCTDVRFHQQCLLRIPTRTGYCQSF